MRGIKSKCMKNEKLEGKGNEKEYITVREITSISEQHQRKEARRYYCVYQVKKKLKFTRLARLQRRVFEFVSLSDAVNLYASIYQDQLFGQAQ